MGFFYFILFYCKFYAIIVFSFFFFFPRTFLLTHSLSHSLLSLPPSLSYTHTHSLSLPVSLVLSVCLSLSLSCVCVCMSPVPPLSPLSTLFSLLYLTNIGIYIDMYKLENYNTPTLPTYLTYLVLPSIATPTIPVCEIDKNIDISHPTAGVRSKTICILQSMQAREENQLPPCVCVSFSRNGKHVGYYTQYI